jgi:hypothetical protein
MFLSHTFSKTNLGAEFLIDVFNKNRQQALFIIAIYKPPQILNTFFFISILKNIVTKIPTNCPTIIIRDFNINMLAYTTKSITYSMNTHNFCITFIEST